ncbi:DUF3299 domain-containing protein [Hyphobacterium sp.]|uniref:DUF3299 domain-containing protein n=1 Tax=Hyphobacterium sp. TaxID=2004662 RepID=UPI003BA85146
MIRAFLALTLFVLASAGLTAPALAQDDAAASQEAQSIPPRDDLPEPDENGVTTINWDHLLPDGEMARIEELYRMANGIMGIDHFGGQMPQIGTFNVEAGLVGRTIRMPGFILPLHYDVGGTIQEFLLVPYFGACVHTPPPPPNQIVYVTSEEPVEIEQMWDPVWVVGELTSERNINGLGDAAYTLHLQSHERYEF